MLSNDIRASFLEFYRQRGHTVLPSASLVPVADPSLLLINAGMAPLKRAFMGLEPPPAARCCNSQKCVRTIDIDQVGRTNRHNTFFEMLGKWSFGDYFKLPALQYTLEWMTGRDWLGLDPARIYITHHERDEETRALWLTELGWPESHLFALGDADNLWAAGDTGPWGYDTEYFWDFAPDGESIDQARFEALCKQGRIVEVGNDVFMQFTRDEAGNSSELPSRNVDYGGGLERFSMVMQDKRTTFQTDCFDYLIRGFAEVVAGSGGGSPPNVTEDELFTLGPSGFNPYWLAADHVRAVTFLLADGIAPGNMKRSYVVRRLIRRIVTEAFILGVRGRFLSGLSDLVIQKMGGHYSELREKRETFIKPWLEAEESKSFKAVDEGYPKFISEVERLKSQGLKIIPGRFLFDLHSTNGFLFPIAQSLAHLHGMRVGITEFRQAREEHRLKAGIPMQADFDIRLTITDPDKPVQFLGYIETAAEVQVRSVEQLADVRKLAPLITAGESELVPGLRIVTDRTPFYSAAGGQPDDTGWLPLDGTNYPMQASGPRGTHVVRALADSELPALEPGSRIVIAVNTQRRMALRRPHTTTHLMLGAMKQVLGTHISQAGSQLDEDVIRFDFSHFQAVAPEEQRRIEDSVNRWILENHAVSWTEMPLTAAKGIGVTAVFDEKYGNVVRVVSVGEGEADEVEGWVSRELCGGTHLDHTAQAGSFAIVKEESVQSGVRRIYALTGAKALAYYRANRAVADKLGAHYKRPLPNPSSVPDLHEYAEQVDGWLAESFGKLEETEQQLREARQLAVEARRELSAGALAGELLAQATEQGGIHVLCAEVTLADRGDVKYLGERFAGALWKDHYVVFIAAEVEGKAALFAKVSGEAIARGVKAVDLIKLAAGICGGGGGGRDDFAEAGGKDGSKVGDAAAAVRERISAALAG